MTYFWVILGRCPFPLRISSVNVTKSAGICGFGHICWRHLYWKTSFFVQYLFSGAIGKIVTDRNYSGLLIVFLGVFFGPQKFIIIRLIDYLLRRLIGISPLFASV